VYNAAISLSVILYDVFKRNRFHKSQNYAYFCRSRVETMRAVHNVIVTDF